MDPPRINPIKKLPADKFWTKSPAPSDVSSIVSAYSLSSMIGGTSPCKDGFPPSKEFLSIDFKVFSLLNIDGSFISI